MDLERECTMRESTRRVYEYDFIKGIMILLVVLGHSYYVGSHGATMADYVASDSNVVSSLFNGYINTFIYSMHMPVYMMISGALSAGKLTGGGTKNYIVNRFKRLIIPYLLCSILYAIPVKYIAGYYYDWSLVKAYVYSIILFQTPAHMWFLVILFLLSCTFAVIYKFKLQRNKLVWLPILFLFMLHDYLPGSSSLLYKYGQFAIYFFAGIMFEEFGIREKINLKLARGKGWLFGAGIGGLYVISFILANIILPNTIDMIAPFRNIFALIEACSAGICFYCIAHRLADKNHKIINYFSKKNFEIYLYHEPLIHVCVSVFAATGFAAYFTEPRYYALSILIRFWVALGGALVVSYFVDGIKRVFSAVKSK